MRIVFNPDTLDQSESGAVTAVVYFDFGGDRQFPEAGWNDFAVVVAGWWMDALHQLVEGQGEAVFRFMDGPYWITAVTRGGNLLLQCVEDRSGAEGPYAVVVALDDFQRTLTSFARDLSNACEKAGIESADLGELRRYRNEQSDPNSQLH